MKKGVVIAGVLLVMLALSVLFVRERRMAEDLACRKQAQPVLVSADTGVWGR